MKLIFLFILTLCFSVHAAEIVLDVRTPAEFKEGHVKGAQLIDFNSKDFKNEIAKLPKENTYKVYCAAGGRSAKAVDVMKELGFQNLENLGGVREAAKKMNREIVK